MRGATSAFSQPIEFNGRKTNNLRINQNICNEHYKLFHSFISGLNPSIYKNGLFILGPFILFIKTLSSDEGWNSRNKAFKHLLLAIIALILTFAIRFIVDSIDIE